jgi:hypothetical protein
MKIYFFDFNVEDLKGFTEVFSVIPYVNDTIYTKIIEHVGIWNEGLFSKLRYHSNHTKVNSIEECDIAVIPFKFNNVDERIKQNCTNALKHNKRVVAFYNDDDAETYNLPNNLVLFRTSLYKSKQLSNEKSLPTLIPDQFPSYIDLPDKAENTTVAFCGFVGNNRLQIIEKFKSLYNNTNMVYNSMFWPQTDSKHKTKGLFYNNLLSSSFSLCIRGLGNFSYRFYEALSFGRIPVLINTDCVLPFENVIDWSKHIISVNENQMSLLPDLISSCNISPASNRKLWQTFFSAEGYYKNFNLEL